MSKCSTTSPRVASDELPAGSPFPTSPEASSDLHPASDHGQPSQKSSKGCRVCTDAVSTAMTSSGEAILHGHMLRYIFCQQTWRWEKTCFAEWRSIRVVSKNIRGECRQLEEIVRIPFIGDLLLKRFLLLMKPGRDEMQHSS